jgi:hypothetical protein
MVWGAVGLDAIGLGTVGLGTVGWTRSGLWTAAGTRCVDRLPSQQGPQEPGTGYQGGPRGQEPGTGYQGGPRGQEPGTG